MRLGLFTVINVVAALLFGGLAYGNGYSAGWIALTVIGVLAVFQFAYVAWLVVVARLQSEDAAAETAGPISRATNGTADRAR